MASTVLGFGQTLDVVLWTDLTKGWNSLIFDVSSADGFLAVSWAMRKAIMCLDSCRSRCRCRRCADGIDRYSNFVGFFLLDGAPQFQLPGTGARRQLFEGLAA